MKKTPIFDTETGTVTDLVNVRRQRNILQNAMLLSIGPVGCMYTVDHFDSEGQLSCDLAMFLLCLVYFLEKRRASIR